MLAKLFERLLRSGAAGALATLTDLAVLSGLVHLAGVTPRFASAPALALGMVVMFFAQRQLVFRAKGRLGKQALLFAVVQLGGLLLTLGLYDVVLRGVPGADRYYLPLRLLVSNLVWLIYSFPLWHLVFAQHRQLTASAGPTNGARAE